MNINEIINRIKQETNDEELINILDNESLLEAFIKMPSDIYQYFNLTDNIIKKSYITILKNPELLNNNRTKDKYYNLIYLINNKYDFNDIINIFNIKEILLNGNYTQYKLFLSNDKMYKIFEDENIYDYVLKQSKIDKKYLSLLPIDNRLDDLNLLDERIKYDNFDLKSLDINLIKKILSFIKNENYSLNFLYNSLDIEQVRKIVLKNNFLCRLLIKYDKLDYFLLDEIKNIIANNYDYVFNMSYNDKINLIKHIEDKEYQIKLIKELSLIEDIKNTDSENKKVLLNSIIDKDYVTNTIIKNQLYNKMKTIDFGKVIHELGKENQYKILNDENFIKYRNNLLSDIYAINFFDIINECAIEIVEYYYIKYNNLGVNGSYKLCEINPTKKNIEHLKNIMNTNFDKNVLYKILDYHNKLFTILNDEDFDYFLKMFNYKGDIDEYLGNNEIILNRQKKLIKKEISNYLIYIKDKGRIEQFINFSYIKYMNNDEIQFYFDHIKLETLLCNINKNELILDYIIRSYYLNKKQFDELNDWSIGIIENKLNKEAFRKYKIFYEQLPYEFQLKLIDFNLLRDESIRNKIINDFAINYNNYLFNESLFNYLLYKLPLLKINEILEKIDIKYFVKIINEKTPKNIIKARKKEIIDYLKKSNDKFLLKKIIQYDFSLINEILTAKEVFELYDYSKVNEKLNNQIIEYLKNNYNVLIYYEEIKKFLANLEIDKINYLISDCNLNILFELYIKTNNIYIENKIIELMNNKCYFENNTIFFIDDIIKTFNLNNQLKINSLVDKEFNLLDIPFKIKNISLDEKIFLLYLYKENIMTKEKEEFISNLILNDPLIIKYLNVNLFIDDIFNISKNFIHIIYRYKDLTVKYIKILKENNTKSDLLIKLINNIIKTKDEDIIIIKLNVIINYLYLKKCNDLVDFSNCKIDEIEKYILNKNNDLVLFGISHFNHLNNKDKDDNKKLKCIIQEKNSYLLDKIKNENNILELKNYNLNYLFGINYEQAKNIYYSYNTSLNKISKITSTNSINLFNLIKTIILTSDINLLKNISFKIKKYDINDLLQMKLDFEKAYNIIFSKNMIGLKNGKKNHIKLNEDEIDVIELTDNFNLLTHSTCAIGKLKLINNNYFDSWNYSKRITNDYICTSFMSEINLGVANVLDEGVMFGFYNLDNNSIINMGPYDIFSYNDDIQNAAYRQIKFMDVNNFKMNIRDTHSEVIIKRHINNIKRQPDCIIIFEEMDHKIKENSVKAQRDFKNKGIDIPIVYINRKLVINNQINKINNILLEFENNFDLKTLHYAICSYESLKCGIKYDNITFTKDRIYNMMLKMIDYIKESKNYILGNEFINMINFELSKFNCGKGKLDNEFDLLDDEMINNINLLKEFINKEMVR